MNNEVQRAYDDAKAMLQKLQEMNTLYVKALDQKSTAEINLDSAIALVMAELESKDISKTALKEIVNGDARVIKAKQELSLAKSEVKKCEARVSFVEKSHDLEKKRMSAEMDEANRFNYHE